MFILLILIDVTECFQHIYSTTVKMFYTSLKLKADRPHPHEIVDTQTNTSD